MQMKQGHGARDNNGGGGLGRGGVRGGCGDEVRVRVRGRRIVVGEGGEGGGKAEGGAKDGLPQRRASAADSQRPVIRFKSRRFHCRGILVRHSCAGGRGGRRGGVPGRMWRLAAKSTRTAPVPPTPAHGARALAP